MRYDPERHHRRSIRLLGYDYTRSGSYFVTVCAHERQCLLGEIADGEMAPNELGQLVRTTWEALPGRFPSVQLDANVLMPNHIHGIITLVGARFIAPSSESGETPMSGLGEVVRAFKAITCREIRRRGISHFGWQRNYHEHIVRSREELERIRRYIANNPRRWEEDRENPINHR